MKPVLILGGSYHDQRGILKFNNDFDLSLIKRMYIIDNIDTVYIRRWQGHKIEQRWFSAISGEFNIELIKIDNWELPSKKLKKSSFDISYKSMDVLQVPGGYVSSIQAMSEGSKLLIMSDYRINDINDEYKFSSDYFKD